MADISLEVVTGKLNRIGYDAFMQALRHAKGAGHRNLELAHWMLKILQMDRTDVALTADRFRDKVAVTDADVAARYEAHKAEYRRGEQRKVKMLLIDRDEATLAACLQRNPVRRSKWRRIRARSRSARCATGSKRSTRAPVGALMITSSPLFNADTKF